MFAGPPLVFCCARFGLLLPCFPPLPLLSCFIGPFRPMFILLNTCDYFNRPCPSSPNLDFLLFFGCSGVLPRPKMTICDLPCPIPVHQPLVIVPHIHPHPWMPTMGIYGHPWPSTAWMPCFVRFAMFCYVLLSALACVFGVFACVFRGVSPSYMS